MNIQQTSEKVLCYRIGLMALAAADVVAGLGEVLFDRRCLRWDTVVLLDDRTDMRPLWDPRGRCASVIGRTALSVTRTLPVIHRSPIFRGSPRRQSGSLGRLCPQPKGKSY